MRILSVLLAFSLLMVSGCKNAPERPDAILDENYEPIVPSNAPTAATTPPATAEPPQNAAGVWHYTCSNGCAGGAGSAVPCATCGTTLVHNTVYHSGGGATQPNVVTNTATTSGGTPVGSMTNPVINGAATAANPIATPPSAPKAPEPPQNAAGVWHYTCSNGCAGGAGSATPCAGCGTTLVHNTVYHQ